jgi:acyl-CoA dehydrogenase
MSAGDQLLLDSATRLFRDLCTDDVLRRSEQGEWLGSHWKAIEDLGLPLALLDEAAGGFGCDPLDALEVIRLAGYHGLPMPLADTMLANRRLSEAGFAPSEGVVVVAPVDEFSVMSLERDAKGCHLRGSCRLVPWARQAAAIVALARNEDSLHLVLIEPSECMIELGANLAGAPRDTLRVDAPISVTNVRPAPLPLEIYLADGAGLRAITMAGALERLLELTVEYAGERVQFGKSLSKFQVIQQNLALLAGQACAASAAADIAARALATGGDILPLAIAKARAGEAAGIACGIAHQVHGAIGFTAEHRLHYFTKLLWACRDECGVEAYWNRKIGRRVAETGANALWPLITTL